MKILILLFRIVLVWLAVTAVYTIAEMIASEFGYDGGEALDPSGPTVLVGCVVVGCWVWALSRRFKRDKQPGRVTVASSTDCSAAPSQNLKQKFSASGPTLPTAVRSRLTPSSSLFPSTASIFGFFGNFCKLIEGIKCLSGVYD